MTPLIGGFFELGIRRPPVSSRHGLEIPADPSLTFSNARSAFAALLRSLGPSKLWLPAYICRSLSEAPVAAGIPVDYYAVGTALEPALDDLSAVRDGEMVVAIDYFGRPPASDFLQFAASRPHVMFVEDAVQALDTGQPQWGQWKLVSPRKLAGIPDGGYLHPKAPIAPDHRSVGPVDRETLTASYLRFEDEEQAFHPLWHQANQRRENDERVSNRRMSRLARVLVEDQDWPAIGRRRQANYRTLATALSHVAFLPDGDPRFVPFGFPLRLAPQRREKLRLALIDQGIFPAIHWAALPSPASFEAEHRLSQELLTLPCDQRYGDHEMRLIAAAVRAAVGS